MSENLCNIDLILFSGKFPIYFVAGRSAKGLLEDTLVEELAQRNMHFTRPFGVAKTAEGLFFAFVSGAESKETGTIQITPSDLEYLEEQYLLSEEGQVDKTLDMLFSWSWPSGFLSGHSEIPVSKSLAPIMRRLKPRYIFSPSHSVSFHFERPPFENIDSKTSEFQHATRFISLADCLNSTQSKWMYAINIEPAKFASVVALNKRPDNCTTNPFIELPKRQEHAEVNLPNYFYQVPHEAVVGAKRRVDDSISSSTQLKRPPPGYICKKCHSIDHFYRDCPHQNSKYQSGEKSTYVCHICHEPGHNIRDCPKKEDRRQAKESSRVTPDTCWFCLSNPAARKHLIIDIGDEVYLTLAKGPLTPEHLLIIPIEHVAGNAKSLAQELEAEFEKFLNRIRSLLKAADKIPIFFRLSNNPSHHYHFQCIPIDASSLSDFLAFSERYSNDLGYKFSDSIDFDKSSVDFIYYDGEEKKQLSYSFDPETFFPAQYGRQLLAAFLDVSEKSDWKSQAYSEEEEKKFVADLKKKFE